MRSFADLPYAIRRRIYTLAGLVRFCPINLNTESANKARYVARSSEWLRNWADFDGDAFEAAASYKCDYRARRGEAKVCYPDQNQDGLDCMCPSLPVALLSVSRAIHDEATAILYSENRFRICKTQPNGLSALLQLSPRAYHHIKSLSIQLNRCCCTPGQECRIEQEADRCPSICPYCHDRCRGGQDAPLLLVSEVEKSSSFLSTWNAVVDRLAQHVQPSKLRLSVICDTANETTAMRVMQPLLALPVPLAGCDIRLSQAPYTPQSAIARSMAVRLTTNSNSNISSPLKLAHSSSFRFLDLPAELQLRILGYTDLVHPSATIALRAACTRPYPLASCCQTCTDTLEACCCAVMHGAYSSSTSAGSCACWTMPTPLFLVSRELYEHSRSVFYSKNVFRIAWNAAEDDEVRRQTLSSFLAAVSPSSRPLIRNIHIRLSDLNYANFEPGASEDEEGQYCFRRDWAESIALLARELSLSNINLWIEDASVRGSSIEHWEAGVHDSLQVEEREWKLYQRLVQPLADAGQPLGNFALKLADPPYGLQEKMRDERRRMLEQRVIGHEYDSEKVPGLREIFDVKER